MKKRLSGGIIALIVVLAIVIIAVVACVSIYNGLHPQRFLLMRNIMR